MIKSLYEREEIILLFFVYIYFFVVAIIWRSLHDESRVKVISNHISNILLSCSDGFQCFLPDLLNERVSVLIYFNSSCSYCQTEADLLVEHYAADSIVNFVFVTSEPIAYANQFQNSHNLFELPNQITVSDMNLELAKYFGLTSVPFTIVYDSSGELIEHFKGEINIESLEKAIQKAHASSR